MKQRDTSTGQTPPSAERQLEELFARFGPTNRQLILSVRELLRKRFRTVNELAYDYNKTILIAYSPNTRGSDAIVSVSVDDNGLRLVFTQGVDLPDPHRLLLGNARQTRYIRLETGSDLLRPEVMSLLDAAVSKNSIPLRQSGTGELIIKSSKKQSKKPE